MATRKEKHARAVAKHEKFMADLHMDNQKWLKQAQTSRLAEQKKAEEARLERKRAKSRALAKAHKSRPQAPDGVAINAQYEEERRRA